MGFIRKSMPTMGNFMGLTRGHMAGSAQTSHDLEGLIGMMEGRIAGIELGSKLWNGPKTYHYPKMDGDIMVDTQTQSNTIKHFMIHWYPMLEPEPNDEHAFLDQLPEYHMKQICIGSQPTTNSTNAVEKIHWTSGSSNTPLRWFSTTLARCPVLFSWRCRCIRAFFWSHHHTPTSS